MAKMNENLSPDKSDSAGLNNFLSRLFGWKKSTGRSGNPVDFVTVDLDSSQKVGQALKQALEDQIPNIESGNLSKHLQGLLDSWLTDTTDTQQELTKRMELIKQIDYAVRTDPYIGQVVKLYADECTQCDLQNQVISIETPDPLMTRRMYELLSTWGITQNRCHSAIESLAEYGNAFWCNQVSSRGVERIIPLKQHQIKERIEFNPVEVAEKRATKTGSFMNAVSKNYLLNKMVNGLEAGENYCDIFDKKLFGFTMPGVDNGQDIILPPWAVTHFRVDGDGQFSPWGTSPLINTLAPFKQLISTIALQSLARVSSFPITLYNVKTSENTDEARQFSTVNKVRMAYDNIGVSPMVGNSEVYSVNTKLWVPKGLLEVDVKKPEVDVKFTDDMEMYQDRVAVASGLPRAYFEKGWGEYGDVSKSLIEQYKPFGRRAYTIQSAFLDGISDLFRLHFAISGEYDYRVPFTLSMKFPAEEKSKSKMDSQSASVDMANKVVNAVKSAIGAGDDEALPAEVVRDIMSKYAFLDPGDLQKWTKASKRALINKSALDDMDSDPSLDDIGGDDLDSGDLGDISDTEGAEGTDSDDLGEAPDITTDIGSADNIPAEPTAESTQTKLERLREKHLVEAYNRNRDDIYFNVLRENNIEGFRRGASHVQVYQTISGNNDYMLETLAAEHRKERFDENKTKRKKK